MKGLYPFAISLLLLATSAVAQNAQGEVRKIDVEQAKITLKHGEIKNLDMPPMTMVFRVRNVSLLQGLSVGDKVLFDAEKVEGQYTVTTIRKAP